MKQEQIVIGGILAVGALAAYAVSRGGSSGSGVAFSQANPQSVAAVESGVSAQIQSINDAAVAKAKIAGDTILGLAGAQAGLLTSQIDASEQIAAAHINADAATSQAQIAADATVKASTILGQTQESIAQINANVQKDISNNQTTQAQAAAGASKASSIFGAISNIVGGVLSFFKPSPGAAVSPTPTTVSYSPEVGPADLLGAPS
jgi:hypothetical protein